MRCQNCGKEFAGEGHCSDCKVAHLSLAVEKEMSAKKSIFKWFIVAVVVLVILAGYIIMKM